MVTSRIVRFSIMLIIGSTCALFAAEQFIAKKSPKGPSIATLKENCCEQLVDSIKQVPDLLSQVARFQQQSIIIVEGYWRSDKESFCQKASKEKLASCSAQLKKLNEKTEDIIAQYKKILSELTV